LAVLVLITVTEAPSWASVSASGGAGGWNPTGTYCPGDWIDVWEMASADSAVDLYANVGYGHTSRNAAYADSLLLRGETVNNGSGTVAEGCHGFLGLDGMTGVGMSKQLDWADIGDQWGNRNGSGSADAYDGVNYLAAGSAENVDYAYTVDPCWMMPPGGDAEPPEVLTPDEISD
jgi:hypothetical protein